MGSNRQHVSVKQLQMFNGDQFNLWTSSSVPTRTGGSSDERQSSVSDRNGGDRLIDSTERGAEGHQDDAIAFAEKRAWKSRPQRFGLVLRDEAIQSEREQPGQCPDEGSHAPPRIAQLCPDQPREDRRIGIRLQKLSKNDPNDDWRPRARATIPSTTSDSPLSAKKVTARIPSWDTKKYAETLPKTMPENESRCGDTPAAAKARPSGIASLESASLKVSMLTSRRAKSIKGSDCASGRPGISRGARHVIGTAGCAVFGSLVEAQGHGLVPIARLADRDGVWLHGHRSVVTVAQREESDHGQK